MGCTPSAHESQAGNIRSYENDGDIGCDQNKNSSHFIAPENHEKTGEEATGWLRITVPKRLHDSSQSRRIKVSQGHVRQLRISILYIQVFFHLLLHRLHRSSFYFTFAFSVYYIKRCFFFIREQSLHVCRTLTPDSGNLFYWFSRAFVRIFFFLEKYFYFYLSNIYFCKNESRTSVFL